MSGEARGGHPDVEVTVERVDVATSRRRRGAEASRIPRRYWLATVAAGAIVVALAFAGVESRDAARKADTNRNAIAAATRASDFANVLALHERILAASRRTTRLFHDARGCRGIVLPVPG